jgi:CelD/BcsL family acetyltransferase involved in cellulose biosynthesis
MPAPFRLEPLANLDEVRPQWGTLAAAASNPFWTPEWCELWLEHVPLEVRQLLFAAVRTDDSVAAIVPLVVVRGRYVRKARLLGFGAANALGPIAAVEDADLAVRALRGALEASRSAWDVFLGESLPGTGWAERLGSVRVGQLANPRVVGPWQSWDAYLATRGAKFRQTLRRKERRLAERGTSLRSVSAAGELEAALDVLFALHRARWGASASRWFAGFEPFHRAFAAAALERGWLRLRVLEVAGVPAAAYIGYRVGDTEWSYQFGRDRALESLSVGLLIAADAIRHALGEKARVFDLGPGDYGYKRQLATDHGTIETVGTARGLRGRASLAAARRRGG